MMELKQKTTKMSGESLCGEKIAKMREVYVNRN
jgi:hypothetical protein